MTHNINNDAEITAAIEKAYLQAETITKESGTIRTNSDEDIKTSINLSSIYDTLIYNTGRFTERFASDLIIDIHNLEEAVFNKPFENKDRIFLFGMRRDGVDHNNYIYSNIKSYASQTGYLNTYYRKILAVKIQIEPVSYSTNMFDITVSIRDITNILPYCV